jgi:hypothetical protein
MEKLEQVGMDCVSALECANLEICVEEIEIESKESAQVEENAKPAKFRLSKVFKKSNLNANYIKERFPIEKLKLKQNYRIYGVY